ncbi:hypothetical protein RHMOL_Rhmol03G0134100 [Rhododendron molle]|uniref:Uncharacterized protein n=1 Tax=Rhododendron molle TaxID=49168 RepID=A0ACC0PE99_RHOML|nr:hypothetical protein RHMOL_Rhmol03G0134100 [Rhododendron molle]
MLTNPPMADHGGNEGEGEVVDQPGDRGETMAVETVEEQEAEAVVNRSVETPRGGDGIQDREQEAAGGEESRAVEAEPGARDQAGAVGSSSEPKGSGMVAEGPPMVDRGSGGAEGNGAVGDNTEPSQTPPRDSAKGAVVEEEHVEEERMEKEQTTEAATVEIREEDIAFRPPATAATSSRHVPITFDDIVEHTPDEILAKLLEDNPTIGEYVLKAKEDRARVI